MNRPVRIFVLCMILLSVWLLPGCTATEEPVIYDATPSIMVDGELYFTTGCRGITITNFGVADGEITSSVDSSEFPTLNDQSNFGAGYEYRYGAAAGTVEVRMGDDWFIYATREVKNRFPDKDDTAEPRILQEPPALLVRCENEAAKGVRTTYSWKYLIGDGVSTGITADGPHPLVLKDEMTPIDLTRSSSLTANAQWNFPPDEVTVTCFSCDEWGNDHDPPFEEIPVEIQKRNFDGRGYGTFFTFELKDGCFVYEVKAEWSSSELYSGTAIYGFYAENFEGVVPADTALVDNIGEYSLYAWQKYGEDFIALYNANGQLKQSFRAKRLTNERGTTLCKTDYSESGGWYAGLAGLFRVQDGELLQISERPVKDLLFVTDGTTVSGPIILTWSGKPRSYYFPGTKIINLDCDGQEVVLLSSEDNHKIAIAGLEAQGCCIGFYTEDSVGMGHYDSYRYILASAPNGIPAENEKHIEVFDFIAGRPEVMDGFSWDNPDGYKAGYIEKETRRLNSLSLTAN